MTQRVSSSRIVLAIALALASACGSPGRESADAVGRESNVTPGTAEKAGEHRLPAGMRVDGELLREICVARLKYGDTVSVRVKPAVMQAEPMPEWPDQFDAVVQYVRRDTSSDFFRMTGGLVNGRARSPGLIVGLRFDVEEVDPTRPGNCYIRGARLAAGSLARDIVWSR